MSFNDLCCLADVIPKGSSNIKCQLCADVNHFFSRKSHSAQFVPINSDLIYILKLNFWAIKTVQVQFWIKFPIGVYLQFPYMDTSLPNSPRETSQGSVETSAPTAQTTCPAPLPADWEALKRMMIEARRDSSRGNRNYTTLNPVDPDCDACKQGTFNGKECGACYQFSVCFQNPCSAHDGKHNDAVKFALREHIEREHGGQSEPGYLGHMRILGEHGWRAPRLLSVYDTTSEHQICTALQMIAMHLKNPDIPFSVMYERFRNACMSRQTSRGVATELISWPMPLYLELLRKIVDTLKAVYGGDVVGVDIGCGQGLLVRILNEIGLKCYGVDRPATTAGTFTPPNMYISGNIDDNATVNTVLELQPKVVFVSWGRGQGNKVMERVMDNNGVVFIVGERDGGCTFAVDAYVESSEHKVVMREIDHYPGIYDHLSVNARQDDEESLGLRVLEEFLKLGFKVLE